MKRPAHILPVIVLAQLVGTSVWFAGNAVLPDLEAGWGIDNGVVWVTVATQVGFILGTLGSAFSGLADRVSPSRLFLISAVLAGLFNAVPMLWPESFGMVIAARLLVGVALAGIYPIGMKVAAGWFDGGLGGALGWLVGALVVGTALPHGIRALGADLPWQSVIGGTSLLCVAGGILLVVAVPDGPHLAKSAPFDVRAPLRLIRDPALRSAALGYLGHMWELYTFWALIPVILATSVVAGTTLSGGVSAWSFATIAIGGVTCALGGM
ncbi:MAG: MFS transporter, partial [Myxococcota bacterium]